MFTNFLFSSNFIKPTASGPRARLCRAKIKFCLISQLSLQKKLILGYGSMPGGKKIKIYNRAPNVWPQTGTVPQTPTSAQIFLEKRITRYIIVLLMFRL